MNLLLAPLGNRALKAYCKAASFNPNVLTRDDFLGFGVTLTPDEKCHALLIALEARKQASLLWALRALGQCR